MSIFTGILTVLYAISGIISLLAYAPTMKDVVIHQKKSANRSSYVLWTFTTLVGFLYCIFLVPDLMVTALYGLSFIACLIILLASIRIDIIENRKAVKEDGKNQN